MEDYPSNLSRLVEIFVLNPLEAEPEVFVLILLLVPQVQDGASGNRIFKSF